MDEVWSRYLSVLPGRHHASLHFQLPKPSSRHVSSQTYYMAYFLATTAVLLLSSIWYVYNYAIVPYLAPSLPLWHPFDENAAPKSVSLPVLLVSIMGLLASPLVLFAHRTSYLGPTQTTRSSSSTPEPEEEEASVFYSLVATLEGFISVVVDPIEKMLSSVLIHSTTTSRRNRAGERTVSGDVVEETNENICSDRHAATRNTRRRIGLRQAVHENWRTAHFEEWNLANVHGDIVALTCTYLFTQRRDGHVDVYAIETNECILSVPCGPSPRTVCATDSWIVVVPSNATQLEVHDIRSRSGVFYHSRNVAMDHSILIVKSISDDVFVFASDDGQVLVWDLREDSIIQRFTLPSNATAISHNIVWDSHYSRFSSATHASPGLVPQKVDDKKKNRVNSARRPLRTNPDENQTAHAEGGAGRYKRLSDVPMYITAACTSGDRGSSQVFVWDFNTTEVVREFSGVHSSAVSSLELQTVEIGTTFAPLIMTASSQDSDVHVYNVSDGHLVHSLSMTTDGVVSLAWDGRKAVICDSAGTVSFCEFGCDTLGRYITRQRWSAVAGGFSMRSRPVLDEFGLLCSWGFSLKYINFRGSSGFPLPHTPRKALILDGAANHKKINWVKAPTRSISSLTSIASRTPSVRKHHSSSSISSMLLIIPRVLVSLLNETFVLLLPQEPEGDGSVSCWMQVVEH